MLIKSLDSQRHFFNRVKNNYSFYSFDCDVFFFIYMNWIMLHTWHEITPSGCIVGVNSSYFRTFKLSIQYIQVVP